MTKIFYLCVCVLSLELSKIKGDFKDSSSNLDWDSLVAGETRCPEGKTQVCTSPSVFTIFKFTSSVRRPTLTTKVVFPSRLLTILIISLI